MEAHADSLPPAPSPEPVLAAWRRHYRRRHGLWVFGYASLIWRPEFRAVEQRAGLVHGWHRALRMRSRINRGTPQVPGLVFALLPGGACRGEVFRLTEAEAEPEFQRLWSREMAGGVYSPRWLPVRTSGGTVPALAFTLARSSEACLARLADPQAVEILRHARGRFGTTLEYLVETARALRQHGIRDREIERLMCVAATAGLLDGADQTGEEPCASRTESRSCAVSTSTSTPGSSTSTAAAG